jgi:ATP-binding cassette subfamily B protein
MKNFKRLLKCVREFKLPAILTLIFIMGEAVIEVFIPAITKDLINEIERGGADMNDIIKHGLMLVLMAALSLMCGGIAAITCAKASAGFSRNVRHDMFYKIQGFSFENIDKFSSSSLVTRMTTDVGYAQMSFMMLIRIAVRAPMLLIFSIIMAFREGKDLAMTFVVVIPVLAFGLFMVARKAMPAFRRVFKKYDRLNESIEENVRGMRVVKGFSRQEYEKEKFNNAAEDICRDFTKAERIVALNSPIMQLCMHFNLIFILLIGSKIIIGSGGAKLGIGSISMMLTYGMQVLMQLMMLSSIFVMLTISGESIRRISEVLDEKSVLADPVSPVTEVKDGSIVFDNVSFKYSATAERFALENINLDIKSGMTVGILGGTGSSKTTLVQLIPRLYDTTEGSIRVGGVDVRDYGVKELRDSVAMVLQKNLLFSGTIKENLRWGNENATDEEVMEACKLACADEFIETFPDKYETKIEQGGTNVSGGQKQRLCIARALLKKPKILILDDSTSAVDTRTDAIIRSAFAKYIPETTKIIIAQRVSSVQDADLILIMENGKIVNSGTHEELLLTSEIYKEIYDQQTNGGDEE